MKKHFLKIFILLILCMSIIPMNLTEMNASRSLSDKQAFPKSQNEKILGIQLWEAGIMVIFLKQLLTN